MLLTTVFKKALDSSLANTLHLLHLLLVALLELLQMSLAHVLCPLPLGSCLNKALVHGIRPRSNFVGCCVARFDSGNMSSLLWLCGRWCSNNSDIAPQAVTEGHARGSLQAPVRDCSALALGCLHDYTELSFLAGLDCTTQDVALASFGEVRVAQRMGVVNVEHVVTANVADTASSRPSIRSWIAKSPGLNECCACRDLGTIEDGIPDEVRVKSLYSGVRSGNRDSFRLDWLLLSRHKDLLLDWLDGVNKKIADSNLLLLGLRLLWLHVNNSLDLRRSISRWSNSISLSGGRAPGSQAITKPGKQSALLVIINRRHADAAHGRLELDERMGVIVLVARMGLAVLAEIGVVTDGTLVADTLNVRQILLVFAKRPVTINAIVTVGAAHWLSQRLIDWNKAVARVDELGVLDTLGAVVPIGTVQTLVANAINELVAAITDGRVANIPPRVAQEIGQSGKNRLGRGGLESMAGVMTMLVVHVALQAKVVVVADDTSNEFPFRQNLDAAVASASWLLIIDNRLLFIGESAWNLLLLRLLDLGFGLDLGCDALRSAVYDVAVLDEALDHPVATSRTVDAIAHTCRAEVVVASVAYAAVEVLVFHRLVTVIAVHDPRGAQIGRLGAEGEARVAVGSREVVEEV
jgi:hypothetical protein